MEWNGMDEMECANGRVAEWNGMECANGRVAEGSVLLYL